MKKANQDKVGAAINRIAETELSPHKSTQLTITLWFAKNPVWWYFPQMIAMPDPRPEGAEWIDAYRWWVRGK